MMEREIVFNNVKRQPFKATGRTQLIKAGENGSEIMSLAYEPEGNSIAVGCFDGSIKLFSAYTGKVTAVLNPAAPSDPVPITCCRFRP